MEKKVNGKETLKEGAKKKNEELKVEEPYWPEGVTEDMLEDWRRKNPKAKIVAATIPCDEDHNEIHKVVLKTPGRRAVGLFEKFADNDPNKAKEILIKDSCLFGYEKVTAPDNDYLFFSCFATIAELLPIGKGIIKNY